MTTLIPNRLALGLLLCALAAPVAAQVARVDYPQDCPGDFDYPEESADPREVGLARGLALLADGRLAIEYISPTLAWAEREQDPEHIPVLKRIAEIYRCEEVAARMAMLGIESAGETVDYFLTFIEQSAQNPVLANAAALVLRARLDPTLTSRIEEAVRTSSLRHGEWGASARIAALGRASLGAGRGSGYWRPNQPTRELVQRIADGEARLFLGGAGIHEDGWLLVPYGYGLPTLSRRILWVYARSHPSLVREANERAAAALPDLAADLIARDRLGYPHTAELGALQVQTARQVLHEIAFPTTAPPLPDIAAVMPALTLEACRGVLPGRPGTRGDTLSSAVFTYRTDAEAPFRLDGSVKNWVTWTAGGAPDGVPPEVFFPEGEGPTGTLREVRASIPPGATVTWTLAGQRASVTEQTPLCGASRQVSEPQFIQRRGDR